MRFTFFARRSTNAPVGMEVWERRGFFFLSHPRIRTNSEFTNNAIKRIDSFYDPNGKNCTLGTLQASKTPQSNENKGVRGWPLTKIARQAARNSPHRIRISAAICLLLVSKNPQMSVTAGGCKSVQPGGAFLWIMNIASNGILHVYLTVHVSLQKQAWIPPRLSSNSNLFESNSPTYRR